MKYWAALCWWNGHLIGLRQDGSDQVSVMRWGDPVALCFNEGEIYSSLHFMSNRCSVMHDARDI